MEKLPGSELAKKRTLRIEVITKYQESCRQAALFDWLRKKEPAVEILACAKFAVP
jgi:hypothetical protein